MVTHGAPAAALDAASEFIKDFGIGFCDGLREVIEIVSPLGPQASICPCPRVKKCK
jgi:hypothetical protein